MNKLKDSCRCIESDFSREGKPYFESFINGYNFIACGFLNSDIPDSLIPETEKNEMGKYFNGFEIFECGKTWTRILENGEYHTFIY